MDADIAARVGRSPIYPDLDFKKPDYQPIIRERIVRHNSLRESDRLSAKLRGEYEDSCLRFIDDWAMTYDPRKAAKRGVESRMPMVLFPRQRELVKWMEQRLNEQRPGAVDKSRDCGASWIMVLFSIWMFLFRTGSRTGYGSRKKEYVDNSNDAKTYFQRILWMLPFIPDEFLPSNWADSNRWRKKKIPPDYAFARLVNHDIGSSIIGEAGDQIGRGDRATVYFLDESAFVAHLVSAEGALSAVTDVIIHMSSVGEEGNEYGELKERHRANGDLFEFDYSDDPRKGKQWEIQARKRFGNKVFNREWGRDEHTGNPNILIPYTWLQACVDAHEKLPIFARGIKAVGYDPSDTGDPKGLVKRHGGIIQEVDDMEDGNFQLANLWAFDETEKYRADVFAYDADGLGVTVGAEARQHLQRRTHVSPFIGSGSVRRPNEIAQKVPRALRKFGMVPDDDRKNIDFYQNWKAQAWFEFMYLVRNTFYAIEALKENIVLAFAEDELISISSKAKKYKEMMREMSKPHKILSATGKRGVESKEQLRKRKIASTNLADAGIYCASAEPPPIEVDDASIKFSRHVNTWEH